MDDNCTQIRGDRWLHHIVPPPVRALTIDWHARKHYVLAGVLVAVSALLVLVYYTNHPAPEMCPAFPDSCEYLSTAHRIQSQGQIVDAHRLPGFPLLIALVFALFGQGNTMAVSIANAVLFILTALETYMIAALMLRRGWAAFLISILVGTNVVLLSFIKPVLSEALALWLVVSVTLVAVLFVHTLQARYLWMAAALMLALCLTRGEWFGLAVPLFAYLILVTARQRGRIRRVLVHAILSTALLYLVLGGYIAANAIHNHFAGMTDTQNIGLWGKVLQYHMQNEASPKYAAITQIANTYQPGRPPTPEDMLKQHPLLSSDHYALAGEYARSIIERHPVEFLAKSVPCALESLRSFYYESLIAPRGPLGGPLLWIQYFYRTLYRLVILFPAFAGYWMYLLFRRPTASLRAVQAMGATALVALYGLILTTLGAYDAYIRYHTPFYPLMVLVIGGGFLAAWDFVGHRVAPRKAATVWYWYDTPRKLDRPILKLTRFGGQSLILRRLLGWILWARGKLVERDRAPSPHIHLWVVLQRLGDLRRGDLLRSGEVGDRPRQLEDAMEGAGGELQAREQSTAPPTS